MKKNYNFRVLSKEELERIGPGAVFSQWHVNAKGYIVKLKVPKNE